jgi:hypothetical protein
MTLRLTGGEGVREDAYALTRSDSMLCGEETSLSCAEGIAGAISWKRCSMGCQATETNGNRHRTGTITGIGTHKFNTSTRCKIIGYTALYRILIYTTRLTGLEPGDDTAVRNPNV